MANLVVVALPSENDYVWKISSEKTPHMTLLFLGEMPVPNFADIAGFVDHASKQTLSRFGMEVDRRGELGPDKADVLFFAKSKWSGYEEIATFRSFLLQDDNIRAAYQAVEQFPEWLPHLTLGYPETPAKPDNRDYPGISYVSFDRIAVWFNDYEGFEYPLKDYEWATEVAMANSIERGQEGTTKILKHYGKKGMKWGVRKDRTSVTVSQKKGGARLRAKGGKGRLASQDAVDVKMIAQVMKKSGVQSLSNKQLQEYNNRLNLEMNARRLNKANTGVGKKFVLDLLSEVAATKPSK